MGPVHKKKSSTQKRAIGNVYGADISFQTLCKHRVSDGTFPAIIMGHLAMDAVFWPGVAHVEATSISISGSSNGSTVPYKAIFWGDISLHSPYIGLIYVRYLQFRSLKGPLTTFALWSQVDHADFPSSNIPKLSIHHFVVQRCGKRWDLPKLLRVLFVNLEFPR